MEAEAELVNYGVKTTLETEFENLSVDEDIEKELRNLKSVFTKKEEKRQTNTEV
jgi:hypothetical protein